MHNISNATHVTASHLFIYTIQDVIHLEREQD